METEAIAIMMFELSQLRCFVAAAEELHFGRAAARLNMTQPPLSRQIQLLERIIGVPLLERTSRLVRVTPAGRVFLRDARRILRLAESAALTTRRVASGEAGTLTVGFTAASGYAFLPGLVSLLRWRLPNIELVLKEMVSSEQIEALLTGRIDIGLLRPPIDRQEFGTQKVLNEALVAALPQGDPRLSQPKLQLTDFHDRPFIMYSPDGAGYFHGMLTALFADAGAQPIFVQHMSQIHSILALVHAGLGAALVPAAATSLHYDDVTFRPLDMEPASPVELHMAWREDSDNPAVAPFLQLYSQP